MLILLLHTQCHWLKAITENCFEHPFHKRNRKHSFKICTYKVMVMLISVWENSKQLWKHSLPARVTPAFLVLPNLIVLPYLYGNTEIIFKFLNTLLMPLSHQFQCNVVKLQGQAGIPSKFVFRRLFAPFICFCTLVTSLKINGLFFVNICHLLALRRTMIGNKKTDFGHRCPHAQFLYHVNSATLMLML